jgi:peptidoglycan hydrolase-like protein with peptidoglycan-binding domain
MNIRNLNTRILHTAFLVLISTSWVANAQQSNPRLTRAQAKEAERLLSEKGYWTGPVDGVLDPATRSAVITFQKWEGRAITGRLTIEEIEALRSSAMPAPRDGSYEHVEVDIDRQVLLIVDDKGGVKVLPVSTGTDKPFVYAGETSIAYTPRGRFVVYDKTMGWEDNLPGMYYPNYISGGIAIHGSYSVPAQPASHGCIRIPVFAAREVSKLLKLGTIVLVYDKVSFVSARSWVENPKLKEAALANGALH